jgi:hypothetical protein
MLLPYLWLRKRWLRRAMRNYPLYDPPHKIEERLLSKTQATENFDYFMQVRHQRVTYLQDWLRRNFWVVVTPDTTGVKALSRWANMYAGLLLDKRTTKVSPPSYFTYEPSWTGDNAGCNVLFDTGTMIGEYLIANCPRLRWDVDPISPVLPRTAMMLKRAPGMSFQRPQLAAADNLVWRWSPLHTVYTFANEMNRYVTTFDGLSRFYRRHREDRRRLREHLVTLFENVLAHYPAFGADQLKQELLPDD